MKEREEKLAKFIQENPAEAKAILEREEKERHQQKLLHERHEKDAR